MNARDHDLLRPSLSSDFDVRGYEPLFQPQSILWPAFFGGPIAGGILFGLNYARMGRRDLALRAWIGSVVLALMLAVVIAAFLTGPKPEADAQSPRQLVRYLISCVSIIAGWFVAQHQTARFTAWVSAGNTPRSLVLPGLLAWLVGTLLMVGLMIGAFAALLSAR